MSLKRCSECGNEVSANASRCPRCGNKINKSANRYIKIACLLIVSLMAFGAIIQSLSNDPDKAARAQRAAQQQFLPEQRQKQKEVIDQLLTTGVIYKIEPKQLAVHVWVTPVFAQLNVDRKQQFLAVVLAYYGADMVTIKDSQTGNSLGSFSRELGLSL